METRAEIQAKIKELEEKAEDLCFEIDYNEDRVADAEEELAESKKKFDKVEELIEKYQALLKEVEYNPDEFVNDTYVDNKIQLKLF
jgi:peptidoglycan hydrolase CwlO-like protein